VKRYGNFEEAIRSTKFEIYSQSRIVAPRTWQSIDVSKRPEMVTHEVKWWGFRVDAGLTPELHCDHIAPNLPWADDHFEERVSGHPLNPGHEWSNWPWASSADKFRTDGMFNHTYAERYWPKYAALLGAIKTPADIDPELLPDAHWGIRYRYGDLNDVVQQLVRDPLTRQAILPVFFPEDTGAVHGDRVPCSIFYQFLVREDKLDIFYYLRSCDFVRHFRDDVYLTLRLQLWMIDQLKAAGVHTSLGEFLMQIGSLHIFRNDWQTLFNEPAPRLK
jgi:hypothetical protein